MCRNIKLLYNFAPPATAEEVHASALQYVRKVTGMRAPTQANKAAFDDAVERITDITTRLLLEQLDTSAKPRDRDVEKDRARARGQDREQRMRERIAREG